MSNIVDRVFAEVCLDERVSDGIFRLEEEEHMNALRDYFEKRGITKEASIQVTNRMVEGRFPERQAYNKDGILVTFPTPQHKQKAIQRGTHFEKNPAPQNTTPPTKPAADEPAPEPKKDLPPPPADDKSNKGLPKSNAEPKNDGPKVQQGDKELAIEPPRSDDQKIAAPPVSPSVPQAPRTPERVAAEKEVVKQILATDDSALTKIEPSLNEACRHQLNELYKKADEWGFREAVTFLTPYVKP